MENWQKTINLVRGLVRPLVTFLVVLALVLIAVFLVVKFPSATLADRIMEAFLVIVATISGFWFGSRKTGGEG